MRITLIFTTIVFLNIPVYGATASGRILDPSGGTVARARVTVYSRDNRIRITGVSGGDGAWRFDNLPRGEYLIEASAPGMSARAAAPLVLGESGAAARDLVLAIEGVKTEVVVTATATAQTVDEVARAVSVLDAPEMELRGEFSVTDALQTVPGVRVQQLGGPGSFTRILSRGLRAQDTAVTIDGLRFRDAATTQGDASPFLETMFLANAGRIEVLRGTGSSVYGTNATGAVVNLVSGEGGGPLHGRVEAEGGGLGAARGAARLSGGALAQRLQFSAGLQHLNVTRGADGFDPARNNTAHGYAQLRPAAGVSFSARIWATDGFAALNDSPYAAPASLLPPAGVIAARPVSRDVQRAVEGGGRPTWGSANLMPNLNDPDSRRSSRGLSSAFVFTQQLAPSASWRVSYQRVDTRRDFEDGPAGVRFEPLYNNSSIIEGGIDTAQARTDLHLSRRHLLSAGYEFERETYFSPYRDAAPVPERYSAEARQRSHSLFGTYQVRAGRLQVALSGRWQRFQPGLPAFTGGRPVYENVAFDTPPAARTGDIALAYFAGRTGTKLRAHAGNGYRAPSIFERFGTLFFDGAFSALGDPRLRPERSAAFDFGLDQYLGGQRVRLSATYFYTNLSEVISFDSSGLLKPATDPYRRSSGYVNTGGGLGRGIELAAEARLFRRSSVQAAYTYNNSDVRNSTVRTRDFFKAPFVSDHQFSAVLLQSITRRLDAAFDFVAVSSHPTILSSRPFLFSGMRKLDAAAHYNVPLSDGVTLRFSLKGANILNSEYLENGFRTPGAWAMGGIGLLF
jgi:iron complex outermembrane receptor protein